MNEVEELIENLNKNQYEYNFIDVLPHPSVFLEELRKSGCENLYDFYFGPSNWKTLRNDLTPKNLDHSISVHFFLERRYNKLIRILIQLKYIPDHLSEILRNLLIMSEFE
jgi:hypothetical protein